MPLSQTEYLWSGATPLLLISPARFFLYKGPKIDYFLTPPLDYRLLFNLVSRPSSSRIIGCVDGSDNRLGKFLFQIIEATRGGMPARDGNRSPRDDRSWGSRAKDFVICAEAALRGKKGDPYPLNNSSLGRWVG